MTRSSGVVAAVILAAGGICARLVGGLGGGMAALWMFTGAAVLLAVVLPWPEAFVSPLFAGVLGWTVDMLPFVVLAGWGAVVVRWIVVLVREKRLPRGGLLMWLPAGLVVWTALGILVLPRADLRHFILLLGLQVLSSSAIVALVDLLGPDDRRRLVVVLCGFVLLLSSAVFLQWVGVPIQSLQDATARRAAESAYGVDAFPNNVGMIKYARSVNAGSLDLRRRLDRVAADHAGMPSFDVIRPKFQAYENHLVVRFAGSARTFERDLARAGVDLVYDNVGLAPANTVPRLRSFPRNALTFAGVCAAVFPLALGLAWTGRRRWGAAAVAASLFGASFSLARGAWVAIAIGIGYLVVARTTSRTQKIQAVVAYLAAAAVLTGVFLVKYEVDPVTGRAGGGASVNTRSELYSETLDYLRGIHIVLGYGTERPRTTSGTTHEGTRYVPRAGTHSTYLNYLFRGGVPLALGIAALYGLAFWRAHSAGRAGEGTAMLDHTVAAAAVVVAAAHAVILSLYVEPVYTLTISLVLGLALAGTPSLARSRRPASS